MKMKLLGIGLVMGLVAAGCGSDDSMCGDGGCPVTPDGGGGGDAATGVGSITTGSYKVTAATVASDECKIDPMSVATAMAALPVEVSGGIMKVGNNKGEPPQPSLGQGPYVTTGGTFQLKRMNHVKVEAPSTCEYDSEVTSTVTLDAIDSFGLGVVEKQMNRKTCMVPEGVGANCTSTWSWRFVKAP